MYGVQSFMNHTHGKYPNVHGTVNFAVTDNVLDIFVPSYSIPKDRSHRYLGSHNSTRLKNPDSHVLDRSLNTQAISNPEILNDSWWHILLDDDSSRTNVAILFVHRFWI